MSRIQLVPGSARWPVARPKKGYLIPRGLFCATAQVPVLAFLGPSTALASTLTGRIVPCIPLVLFYTAETSPLSPFFLFTPHRCLFFTSLPGPCDYCTASVKYPDHGWRP